MSADPVTAGLEAATEGLKLTEKVQDEKNTPEMVKAAEAAREQAAVDKTNTALANGDVKEIEKEAAG